MRDDIKVIDQITTTYRHDLAHHASETPWGLEARKCSSCKQLGHIKVAKCTKSGGIFPHRQEPDPEHTITRRGAAS